MPITKREIEALQMSTTLWDSGRGAVPGFGVRCQKKARVFVVKCSRRGRQRWITIGRFGAPWTVENARAEALRILGEIASGNDPSNSRTRNRPKRHQTVGDICERYMDAAEAGLVLTRFNRPKRASTLAIDKGRIERHIRPLIGALPVAELDARAVRGMIADISTGKTSVDVKTGLRGRAIVKGGKATAARVADLLSGIMAWAVEEEIVDRNPVHGVRRFRSEPRDRYLSDDEYAALGRTLNDSALQLHPFVPPIVELLCLTGCRYSEIAELRWSEIDFQEECLRLAESKTGRSMRALGRAPLTRLKSMSRLHDNEHVFPASHGEGPYRGAKRQITALFRLAGIDNATSHTLRHSFASVASRLGYADTTIGGLLGHANRGITSRYIHRPDEALKSAANAVSDKIDELMRGQRE